MKLLKTLLVTTGTLAVCGAVGYLGGRVAIDRASPIPDTLGVTDGNLAPCPDTPNCVSSQATDPAHQIDPIPYTGSLAEAQQVLLEIVDDLPNTHISAVSSDYILAESRSSVWGFVDDTELYLDDEAKLIHIRAAARLGREDFSVNRNRALEIRERFLARQS